MFLESRRQPHYGTGTRVGTKRLVPGTWSCCRVLFLLLWLPGGSRRSVAVCDGLHVEEADMHLGFNVNPLPHLQGEGGERGQDGGSAPCPHRTPRSLRPPSALLLGRRAEMPPTLRKSSKVMPSYTWSGPWAQRERKHYSCPTPMGQGPRGTGSPAVGPLELQDMYPTGAQPWPRIVPQGQPKIGSQNHHGCKELPFL